MKKSIKNFCLALMIALPLLPALSMFASTSSEEGISTFAFFEQAQEY